MWYPALPDVLHIHERICAVQNSTTEVANMSAVDAAVLAPQRVNAQKRSPSVMARKIAALVLPLLSDRAFEEHNEQAAFAVAQRFADRNGYALQASLNQIRPYFQRARSDDLGRDELASWLQSRLTSRLDSARAHRIFQALNTLAEVKEDLERVPGLHEEAERVRRVGAVVTQNLSSLFRLDDDVQEDILSQYPSFSDAWRDALRSA
jgi:prophage maintenance system killer protein